MCSNFNSCNDDNAQYNTIKDIFDESDINRSNESLEETIEECIPYIEDNFTADKEGSFTEATKMRDNPEKGPIIHEIPEIIIQKNDIIQDKILSEEKDPKYREFLPFMDIAIISSDNPDLNAVIGASIPNIWDDGPITLQLLIQGFKEYAKNVVIFDFTCNNFHPSRDDREIRGSNRIYANRVLSKKADIERRKNLKMKRMEDMKMKWKTMSERFNKRGGKTRKNKRKTRKNKRKKSRKKSRKNLKK